MVASAVINAIGEYDKNTQTKKSLFVVSSFLHNYAKTSSSLSLSRIS